MDEAELLRTAANNDYNNAEQQLYTTADGPEGGLVGWLVGCLALPIHWSD